MSTIGQRIWQRGSAFASECVDKAAITLDCTDLRRKVFSIASKSVKLVNSFRPWDNKVLSCFAQFQTFCAPVEEFSSITRTVKELKDRRNNPSMVKRAIHVSLLFSHTLQCSDALDKVGLIKLGAYKTATFMGKFPYFKIFTTVPKVIHSLYECWEHRGVLNSDRTFTERFDKFIIPLITAIASTALFFIATCGGTSVFLARTAIALSTTMLGFEIFKFSRKLNSMYHSHAGRLA